MTHFSCNFASKFNDIKRLKHIFASIAWIVCSIYVAVLVLLHIPAVQLSLAQKTSEILSEKLGTNVHVGTVSLGLLNRIIIDDVTIDDQSSQQLMTAHRLSAKINVIALLRNRIDISSAQIFGMKARITQANADAPLNFQFIVDSLASKDTINKTPLDLHIASLIIRNTSINYDRLDLPRRHDTFDVNHIALCKISSHIMLNALTDDSLSVRLKKLAFVEQNTGFAVNSFSFVATADTRNVSIHELSLKTDNSDISIDATIGLRDKTVTKLNFRSNHSSIGTKDIAHFVPSFSTSNRTLFLDANISVYDNKLDINELSIRSSGRSLYLSLDGKATSTTNTNILEEITKPEQLNWNTNIRSLHADHQILPEILAVLKVNTPILSRLGSIDYSLHAEGRTGGIASAKGILKTAVGEASHDISLLGGKLKAAIHTNTLKLGTLLASDIIGDTKTDISVDADCHFGDRKDVTNAIINVKAPLFTLKGYTYRNIEATATKKGNLASLLVDIADMNVNALIKAEASNADALLSGNVLNLKDISVSADIHSISPYMLGLTKAYNATTFAASLKTSVANLLHPLDNLVFDVNNFAMYRPDKETHIKALSLMSSITADHFRQLTFVSDFAYLNAEGQFDYQTLYNSLFNLVRRKLPTLPGMPQFKSASNVIRLSASVSDSEPLRDIFGLDINITEPVKLGGFIDDFAQKADISVSSKSIQISGTTLDDSRLHVFTQADSLNILARTSRRDSDGGHLDLSLSGKAANNNLLTSISVNSGRKNGIVGSLNTTSQFFKNADGASTANIIVQPSEITIGDSLWNIHNSNIVYSANNLKVNNFLIDHGAQHIRIDGKATKSSNDSLVVNLQDVNVAYILNLANFHSVEFSGDATGNAVVKSLFSAPDAYADLDVRNFCFENGRLGALTVHGQWDNSLGQINVSGRCLDHDVVPAAAPEETFMAAGANIFDDVDDTSRDGRTDVNGYISIKRNYIDLDIKARNTRLEFMQTYCDAFMDNIVAWASGNVRIWGDLRRVNLTGDAIANGSVRITSLNTYYTLLNDSVKFIPNDILVDHAVFFDKHGNKGTISGALHHRYLARMTFDLDVEASHLLCYDFPTLNGETFCGHVIGTGHCKMTGRPGQVTFDIEAFPEETSEFTYNVSSPDAQQNQEFIEWREGSTLTETVTNGTLFVNNPSLTADADTTVTRKNERDVPDEDFRTNLYLNFLIHATPASTLRLIMDERTGDVITFHGNGTLRANYYNKGGMQIFGNYNIESGDYKMTIQQVINKNFEFLPGGSLSFGGDPFEAAINLKAQYVVPSVPLSDLNIGNSFSNNTVRVNCLMNISGTAGQPQVEFDLNLPQASTDIQQMITSLMDGEEERNQQVLYLLSVGRFYAANNNASDAGQSKASIAMQSFLSGTLSQQLNNIISNNILKNQNWNFGTNISPGDEGMNNAEYEGLISGRMLNNRLLINGQFGYRDNANATTSFIGDFDVRYLLFPNGNLQVRVYNQTSDRYFTKSNLNTQGIGIIFKHDFNSFIPYFLRKKTTTKK